MDFTLFLTKRKFWSKGEFIKTLSIYSSRVTSKEDLWEINGETNEIPNNSGQFVLLGLDMYKSYVASWRKTDAYGGLFDPKDQKFPNLDTSKAGRHYFDKGVECYEKGRLKRFNY